MIYIYKYINICNIYSYIYMIYMLYMVQHKKDGHLKKLKKLGTERTLIKNKLN